MVSEKRINPISDTVLVNHKSNANPLYGLCFFSFDLMSCLIACCRTNDNHVTAKIMKVFMVL